VRDRHCQHPAGCDVPVDRCDVDHIVPHARGGETSQFNGRLECTAHNRHADLHDHDAVGLPARPITQLDRIRARIRWRILHDHPEDHEPPLDSRVC
jgi:5-methylcytosine-specific restriction endonuclease McrA